MEIIIAMEMTYIDTQKTLYSLYQEGKITLWQATLIMRYINGSHEDEKSNRMAIKLIEKLNKHKVINNVTCYAMANRYSTYCSGCEFVVTEKPVRHSFIDPFPVSLLYYFPGSFLL